MDLRRLMDTMTKLGRDERQRYHLNLGELIRALDDEPEDKFVMLDDGRFPDPDSFGSYRGYYEDLAFTVRDHETTVAEFLAAARKALGSEFTGYKGGEFVMDESTPLWISDYGESGGVAVVAISGRVLTTKAVD